MGINRRLSVSGCWKMVNAIENAGTPAEVRTRCAIAEEWLKNNDVISNADYDDLMDTVAYICRESYHR